MNTPTESAQRAPNPLLAVLGRSLQTALNHALSLDTETRASLAALDGQAVSIEFRGTGRALRCVVAGERLLIGPVLGNESNLRVAATPGSLLGMAAARLRGDSAPDIDAVFTRSFGDVVGFQMARLFRRGFRFARDSASALAHTSAEYLVEESRDLIAKAEMEQFLDDVDEVRERADRLQARFARVVAARGA